MVTIDKIKMLGYLSYEFNGIQIYKKPKHEQYIVIALCGKITTHSYGAETLVYKYTSHIEILEKSYLRPSQQKITPSIAIIPEIGVIELSSEDRVSANKDILAINSKNKLMIYDKNTGKKYKLEVADECNLRGELYRLGDSNMWLIGNTYVDLNTGTTVVFVNWGGYNLKDGYIQCNVSVIKSINGKTGEFRTLAPKLVRFNDYTCNVVIDIVEKRVCYIDDYRGSRLELIDIKTRCKYPKLIKVDHKTNYIPDENKDLILME